MSKNNEIVKVLVTPILIDDNTGVTVEYPQKPNLILDNGLNYLSQYNTNDCIKYAVIGEGNTETYRQSTGNIISKVGKVLSATTSFFIASDVNKIIQMSDNSEYKISTFIDDVTVEVLDDSDTFTGYDCKIWNTTANGIVSPVMITETYTNTLPEYNGTDIVSDATSVTITLTRTFEFKFGNVDELTITEAGWGPESDITGPMFGRILFDTPIPVCTNQRLLIKVSIIRAMPIGATSNDIILHQPATIQVPDVIGNLDGFSYIGANGESLYHDDILYILEPYHNEFRLTLYDVSDQVIETFTDSSGEVDTFFRKSWRDIYVRAVDFTTPIKAIGIGTVGNPDLYYILYDTPQTLVIPDYSRLNVILQWGRVLPEYV